MGAFFQWEQDEVAATVIKGVPHARWLVPAAEGVLQLASVHSLVGESSAGKSYWCAGIAKTCIESGLTVVYLDAENGVNVIADRLSGLGVRPDVIRKHLRYCAFPEPSEKDAEAVRAEIAAVNPALVIYDSGPDFYAAIGVESENDNMGITRWNLLFAQPVARETGAAVVILEPTNSEGNLKRGRGATSKRFKTDIGLAFEKLEPFGRDTTGLVRVAITKDRNGHRVEGDSVSYRVGGGVFERADEGRAEIKPSKTDKEAEMLELVADAVVALFLGRAAKGEHDRLSKNQVADRLPPVPGYNRPLVLKGITRAVDDMERPIDSVDGPRNAEMIGLRSPTGSTGSTGSSTGLEPLVKRDPVEEPTGSTGSTPRRTGRQNRSSRTGGRTTQTPIKETA